MTVLLLLLISQELRIENLARASLVRAGVAVINVEKSTTAGSVYSFDGRQIGKFPNGALYIFSLEGEYFVSYADNSVKVFDERFQFKRSFAGAAFAPNTVNGEVYIIDFPELCASKGEVNLFKSLKGSESFFKPTRTQRASRFNFKEAWIVESQGQRLCFLQGEQYAFFLDDEFLARSRSINPQRQLEVSTLKIIVPGGFSNEGELSYRGVLLPEERRRLVMAWYENKTILHHVWADLDGIHLAYGQPSFEKESVLANLDLKSGSVHSQVVVVGQVIGHKSDNRPVSIRKLSAGKYLVTAL